MDNKLSFGCYYLVALSILIFNSIIFCHKFGPTLEFSFRIQAARTMYYKCTYTHIFTYSGLHAG